MKIKHILKSTEFKKLVRYGSKIQGETMTLYLSQESGSGQRFIGLIVPKKTVSLAVKRNFVRRLIYAYFQNKEKELRPNFKAVIRLDKIGLDNRKILSLAIREELGELIKRSGIIA